MVRDDTNKHTWLKLHVANCFRNFMTRNEWRYRYDQKVLCPYLGVRAANFLTSGWCLFQYVSFFFCRNYWTMRSPSAGIGTTIADLLNTSHRYATRDSNLLINRSLIPFGMSTRIVFCRYRFFCDAGVTLSSQHFRFTSCRVFIKLSHHGQSDYF